MTEKEALKLAETFLIAAEGYRQLADEAEESAQAALDEYAVTQTDAQGIQVGQVWTYGAGKWGVAEVKGVRAGGQIDVRVLVHEVKSSGYADRSVRLDVQFRLFLSQFTLTQETVKKRGRTT
jgi:hypothetical protein